MRDDFASLICNAPGARVLGVRMQPFSFGHLLLLKAQLPEANAFVSETFPHYEDLIAAAFICAHTWEENHELRRKPFQRWLRLKVWGGFVALATWLAQKLNRPLPFNVLDEILAFKVYADAAQELPQYRQPKPGACKHLYSEWDTRLYAYLRSVNYSHAEAMNLPLLIAHRLFVAHLEDANKMEFKSQFDLGIEERMSKMLDNMPELPPMEGRN